MLRWSNSCCDDKFFAFILLFSGNMYVSEKLDREKVNSYHLVVTAKDGGNKVRYPAKSINFSDRERQWGYNLVDSWEILSLFFFSPNYRKV